MSGAANIVDERDLHGFVDGRLTPDRRQAVERYLETNPEAAADVAAWQSQNEALQKAYGPVVGETVPLRLSLVRLDTRQAMARGGRWTFGFAGFAAGLVAGAVVTVLTWGALRGYPAAAPQSVLHETLARRALVAHQTFTPEVRHPVEVRSGEAHLAMWLQRRTTVPIRLPDLAGEGFSLLGGRLLPGGGAAAAALLMYESKNGERLTLYLSRAGTGGETAFRYQEDGGTGAFYWVDRNVGYVLTGPPDRDRLLVLAKRIYDAFDPPAATPRP
jgi:anti-sigma factor RsiW